MVYLLQTYFGRGASNHGKKDVFREGVKDGVMRTFARICANFTGAHQNLRFCL